MTANKWGGHHRTSQLALEILKRQRLKKISRDKTSKTQCSRKRGTQSFKATSNIIKFSQEDSKIDHSSLTTLQIKPRKKQILMSFTTYPKLVIHAGWVLFDKSTIVCSNISVMRIFLQHVNFLFNFFFFILH